jgi:hypothetical protein
MSIAFFAGKSAEVGEHCRLARDDMYRIQEYLIEPVDRVAVARECLRRITAAVRIRHAFGVRRVRGAAEELNKSLEIAVRTIEWLMSERLHRTELERPVELEAAEALLEVVRLIVSAGTLKITRLKELHRAYLKLKEHAWFLYQRAQQPNDRRFGHLDEELLSSIRTATFGLSFKADDVCSEITGKMHQLRRCRRRRSE